MSHATAYTIHIRIYIKSYILLCSDRHSSFFLRTAAVNKLYICMCFNRQLNVTWSFILLEVHFIFSLIDQSRRSHISMHIDSICMNRNWDFLSIYLCIFLCCIPFLSILTWIYSILEPATRALKIPDRFCCHS